MGLTSKANPLTTYALNLKLAGPSDAPAFAYDRFNRTVSHRAAPYFSNWEGLESEDALLVQDGQGVLQPGTLLLALLAIASVAVLVGRRLSEYARRVGLLKAVGGTPGWSRRPSSPRTYACGLRGRTRPGGRLARGAAAHQPRRRPHRHCGRAPVSPGTVAEVIGLAIAVALAATLVPAIRASRAARSTRSTTWPARRPAGVPW